MCRSGKKMWKIKYKNKTEKTAEKFRNVLWFKWNVQLCCLWPKGKAECCGFFQRNSPQTDKQLEMSNNIYLAAVGKIGQEKLPQLQMRAAMAETLSSYLFYPFIANCKSAKLQEKNFCFWNFSFFFLQRIFSWRFFRVGFYNLCEKLANTKSV